MFARIASRFALSEVSEARSMNLMLHWYSIIRELVIGFLRFTTIKTVSKCKYLAGKETVTHILKILNNCTHVAVIYLYRIRTITRALYMSCIKVRDLIPLRRLFRYGHIRFISRSDLYDFRASLKGRRRCSGKKERKRKGKRRIVIYTSASFLRILQEYSCELFLMELETRTMRISQVYRVQAIVVCNLFCGLFS